MKTFEFTEQEIEDLRKAMNFYVDYVYMEDGPHDRVKALADRLAPKKVTKEGWLVVFADGGAGLVYFSEDNAKEAAMRNKGAQVIKTTWEQEE